MENLMIFKNEELGIKVRTIKNEDGSISINAEDTARGFGWITVRKNRNDIIKWKMMNDYIKEIGFPYKCRRGDYIPESLFYLLGMKANNETVMTFQHWIAIKVIPIVREIERYIPSYEGDTEDSFK